MKIKSTLIIIGLVLGLFACSKNSGVLQNAKPVQNTTLKSTTAKPEHGKKFHMLLRGVNNTQFIAGGGHLINVDLVQKGNARLGIREKRVTIFHGNEDFNDLLDMNSGIMLDLADGQLTPPPGTYDFAVATVTPGSGWVEKANGDTCKLKFPGNKFILVFKPSIVITTSLSPDLVLDIDVNHSVVPMGHNRYLFKPIVKAINNTQTGSAIGVVKDGDGNVIADANVYVDYNGTQIGLDPNYNDPTTLGSLSYLFNTQISYWIPGIPPGTYTIYATKNGYNTAQAEITINLGNFTFVPDLTLTPAP